MRLIIKYPRSIVTSWPGDLFNVLCGLLRFPSCLMLKTDFMNNLLDISNTVYMTSLFFLRSLVAGFIVVQCKPRHRNLDGKGRLMLPPV